MGWNFYNASGELLINDGGVQASAAVFTGKVDLGSNLLVGNAGSTGIAISANGEVNMAAQPCVTAFNSTTRSNVTGTSAYTAIFDTEIFDQNSDFDGTSTFTAPITGRYLVIAVVSVLGITDDMNSQISNIVASNRTWMGGRPFHPGDIRDANNQVTTIYPAIIDMDASDTFTILIRLLGGSDEADVAGNPAPDTYLSVHLVA